MSTQVKKWWSVLSFGTALSLMFGLAMVQSANAHSEHRVGMKGKPKPEQCDGKSYKYDHFQIFEDHADELGLDKKTRTEIDKIKASTKESTTALRTKIRDTREELHTLINQEPTNEETILKKVDELEKLEADKHRQRVKSILAVQALLTKEQRVKLKEIREECRKQCGRDDDDDDDAGKDVKKDSKA